MYYFRKINIYIILSLLQFFFVSFSYADAAYGYKAMHLSLLSKFNDDLSNIFIVHNLTIDNDKFTFSNFNDNEIFSSDGLVRSAYDSSVTYSIEGLLERSDYRFNLTGFLLLNKPGDLISLGLDSGASSAKLAIKPAFRIGYASTIALTKSTYISYFFDTWLGGGITEQPCIDEYERSYSCRNLIAWADRTPIKQSNSSVIALKYTFIF